MDEEQTENEEETTSGEEEQPESENITRKAVKITMKVPLPDSEAVELAREMCELHREIGSVTSKAKDVAKSYKTRIEGLEEKVDDIVYTIQNGVDKQVSCIEVMDFDAGMVTHEIPETGEVIQSRDMTPADRQTVLPIDDDQEEDAGDDSGVPISTENEELPEEELVERAIEVIRDTGRAALTTVQRRLSVGVSCALRILEILEERGILGPPNGEEPREILVDLDEDIPDEDDTAEEEELEDDE